MKKKEKGRREEMQERRREDKKKRNRKSGGRGEGLALVVAGVWWLLGGPTGLVALGVVCIVLALIINYNRSFHVKH